MIKGLISGQWFWYNSQLGMPFGADMRDFPVNMTVESLVVKLIGVFTSNPGTAVNLLWLFATCTCAGTATFAFQRMGLSRLPAGALGVVYALQPYALYRGVTHLNLIFYLVPLLAAGALELALGRRTEGGPVSWRSIRCAVPLYLIIAAVLQGLSYIYYSFFACFLFAVVAALALLRKDKVTSAAATLVILVISCAALVNISPSLVFWAQQGKNRAMEYKRPSEAETYGLKIRHLLTPITDHRFPPLRTVERKLASVNFPDENENATARLGLAGSIGFLWLLFWGIRAAGTGRVSPGKPDIFGVLFTVTLCFLLLATVGGFSSFFNTFLSSDVRCYNRVVVFLDFFCLLALGLLIASAIQRFGLHLAGWRGNMAVVFLALVAVADEAPTAKYLHPEMRKARYEADERFVARVEAVLPENAMVLQLPYTEFPAEGPPGTMEFYEHSRAYIHSHKCRWSWGALTGRGGEFLRPVGQMPAKDILEKAVLYGFQGIWLNNHGYPAGSSPEKDLIALLPTPPLRSDDGIVSFFSLVGYTPPSRLRLSAEEWNSRAQLALHPVLISYASGFYPEEHGPGRKWSWCRREGELVLRNTLNQPRQVLLTTTLQTGQWAPHGINITDGVHPDRIMVSTVGSPYARRIDLSPSGTVTLHFDTDAPPLVGPNDPRDIYFGLINVTVNELQDQPEAIRTQRLNQDPVQLSFSPEFYSEERTPGQVQRWCGPEGTLLLKNPLREARNVVLTFGLHAGTSGQHSVRIADDRGTQTLKIDDGITNFTRKIVLEPSGSTSIRLSYDGPKLAAPGDPRSLYFSILNWRLVDEPPVDH